MPGLISYDTNVSLCVMKCPCGWPMLGRCCDPPDQHPWAGRDEPEGAKPPRPLALSRGDPGVQRGFPYPGFAGVSAGAGAVSLPVTPLNRDSVSGVGALDSAERGTGRKSPFEPCFSLGSCCQASMHECLEKVNTKAG